MLTTRNLQFKVQSLDDQNGRFNGRASVYGNVDAYGDVVVRGAFDQTLKELGGKVVILSQHDPTKSIGLAELVDGQDGLHCRGALELELSAAREDYVRLKKGLISGISIGFETLKDRVRNGIREILELRLWEISLVTFPANQLARVTAVKRATASDARLITDMVNELRLAKTAQRLTNLETLARRKGR